MRVETYEKDNKGNTKLVKVEEVPDPEPTQEDQEIEALKARVATLEAKLP